MMMMEEIKTIWTNRRLITAWRAGGRFEVTVLDADNLTYLEGFSRKFYDPREAVDYADGIARKFEHSSA